MRLTGKFPRTTSCTHQLKSDESVDILSELTPKINQLMQMETEWQKSESANCPGKLQILKM